MVENRRHTSACVKRLLVRMRLPLRKASDSSNISDQLVIVHIWLRRKTLILQRGVESRKVCHFKKTSRILRISTWDVGVLQLEPLEIIGDLKQKHWQAKWQARF
jgi:hypothetical protein